MKNLLLTLGHNSSAILIEDGRLVWGYETERLSGLKSDSRFPKIVLEAKNALKPDMIYATHWAPTGKLSSMSAKHWQPELFDGIPIRSLTPTKTHHDTHLAAAMCYAGPYFTMRSGLYALVIDGFGTFGEHLSIYEIVHNTPVLRRRVHGYDTSLGLFYQYATAFMGMKMHEDEYKLLGYEVHCPMDLVEDVENAADLAARDWLDRMEKSIYGSAYDPLYNLEALESVKQRHFEELTKVCKAFDIEDPTSHLGRSILAKFVQTILENVVLTIVDDLKPNHLLCSGGVFLNVKLNKRLIDSVRGQLCVYPLAGDQGNAIGLYHMDHPLFSFPSDGLCWGQRHLRNVGKVDGVLWMNEASAKEYVIDMLLSKGYVNLVRGNMEFGPRALCNTSTLAIATEENVARINRANDRNTVMPMAPVMTPSQYYLLFQDTDKVWKSEEHMIVAMKYRSPPTDVLRGVAHRYDAPDALTYYTGRPQVVDQRDTFMMDVLSAVGHPIINTSFNYHGKPIAYDSEQVILNHRLQYERDDSFETVIIPN